VLLPENQFFDVEGNRDQNVAIVPMDIYINGQGLENEPLVFSIHSNTQLIDPALACNQGVADVTKDENDAFLDPNPAENSIPAYFAGYTIDDLRTDEEGGPIEPITIAIPEEEQALIGATCDDTTVGSPVTITIPAELFQDGILDIQLSLMVRVNLDTYIPGHVYDYRIEVEKQ